MYKTVIILFIIALIAFGYIYYIMYLDYKTYLLPDDSVTSQEAIACEKAGGTFRAFGVDECSDSCSWVRLDHSKPQLCAAFPSSCDCGPDKCWAATTCEPNPGKTANVSDLISCDCNSTCPANSVCAPGCSWPKGADAPNDVGPSFCYLECDTDSDCAAGERCVTERVFRGDIDELRSFCMAT